LKYRARVLTLSSGAPLIAGKGSPFEFPNVRP
jgi:hypothetical protein